jgi:hypothetical protein
LKDIANTSNQPYLQAIASVSLLIMETVQVRPLRSSPSALLMTSLIVQRVKDNKDGEFFCYEISPKIHPEPVLACMKMTERAYELLCAIINICRDAEAEVAPAMVRSIIQFSESVAFFSHFGTPPAHNFHSGRSKKSSPSSGIKSREAFCSARWRTQTSSKSAMPASSTHWTF